MKTIALDEKTFNLLRLLKEKEKITSFNELLLQLIIKKNNVPNTMFGIWKGKVKKFSAKEREDIWGDL